MSRILTQELFNALQNGILYPLLQEVQNDDTLCLEFRGNSANVYYRGGSLFKIRQVGNQYGLFFDLKYNTKKDPLLTHENLDIQTAISYIPFYKRAMDYWFCKNEKLERENQQLILRENNCTKGSRGSDYFIMDIEYNDTNNSSSGDRNGRYDMVAIKWLSQGAARRNTKKPTLSLIELKYGDGALKNDAGIKKHLDDFAALLSNKEKISALCEEMNGVYTQKHQLGLLRGLDGSEQGTIAISTEGTEVIFVFSNHDPDSSVLRTELQSINWSSYSFPIRFAVSSAMGYNLYADKMIDATEFIKSL